MNVTCEWNTSAWADAGKFMISAEEDDDESNTVCFDQ